MIDVENNEIAQLFVCASARKRGVGKALLLDAESRLRIASHSKAWLTVVVGNNVACDFYESCGWIKGEKIVRSSGSRQDRQLKLWLFEKSL